MTSTFEKITSPEQRAEVEAYVSQAVRQTDIQRESADTEKTGVFTGGYMIKSFVDLHKLKEKIADVLERRRGNPTASYTTMLQGTGFASSEPYFK